MFRNRLKVGVGTALEVINQTILNPPKIEGRMTLTQIQGEETPLKTIQNRVNQPKISLTWPRLRKQIGSWMPIGQGPHKGALWVT